MHLCQFVNCLFIFYIFCVNLSTIFLIMLCDLRRLFMSGFNIPHYIGRLWLSGCCSKRLCNIVWLVLFLCWFVLDYIWFMLDLCLSVVVLCWNCVVVMLICVGMCSVLIFCCFFDLTFGFRLGFVWDLRYVGR